MTTAKAAAMTAAKAAAMTEQRASGGSSSNAMKATQQNCGRVIEAAQRYVGARPHKPSHTQLTCTVTRSCVEKGTGIATYKPPNSASLPMKRLPNVFVSAWSHPYLQSNQQQQRHTTTTTLQRVRQTRGGSLRPRAGNEEETARCQRHTYANAWAS